VFKGDESGVRDCSWLVGGGSRGGAGTVQSRPMEEKKPGTPISDGIWRFLLKTEV